MKNQIKIQTRAGVLSIDADKFTLSKCKCGGCGQVVYRVNNYLFKHMLLERINDDTYINHFFKCLRVRENNRKSYGKEKKQQ